MILKELHLQEERLLHQEVSLRQYKKRRKKKCYLLVEQNILKWRKEEKNNTTLPIWSKIYQNKEIDSWEEVSQMQACMKMLSNNSRNESVELKYN